MDEDEVRQDGDGRPGTQLVFEGALDLLTGPSLLRVGREMLEVDELDELVVDLSRCDFADSSGLLALMRLKADAVERGKLLRVPAATPSVRRALEIIGLADEVGLDVARRREGRGPVRR